MSRSVSITEDASKVAASFCSWHVKGRTIALSSGWEKEVVPRLTKHRQTHGASARMALRKANDTCAGATSKRHNRGRAGVPALMLAPVSKRNACKDSTVCL